MITITVVGGVGQESRNFGNAACESVCLVSPDDTPMYDFKIIDSNGFFVVGATGINAQKTKINERFRMTGVCTLYITNAVDDGQYKVETFSR
mgnify:CR=1 FL=1